MAAATPAEKEEEEEEEEEEEAEEEAVLGSRSPPPRCRPGRARRDVVRPRRREGGGGAAGAAQAAAAAAAAAAAGPAGAPGGDLKGPCPRRGACCGDRNRAGGGGGSGCNSDVVEEEQPGGPGPGGPARFFWQSLAASPPECQRGVFFQVTQHNRRGMEKAVPNFSERQGDGGRALLMTPEPNKETFPALECPQGEERRAAFLQDAKKPLENLALSGTSVEAETELEEDAFYAVDDLAAISREGKGPSGAELHPLQEDPNFFSPLSRPEPDVALEAHDVAGSDRAAEDPDQALLVLPIASEMGFHFIAMV